VMLPEHWLYGGMGNFDICMFRGMALENWSSYLSARLNIPGALGLVGQFPPICEMQSRSLILLLLHQASADPPKLYTA